MGAAANGLSSRFDAPETPESVENGAAKTRIRDFDVVERTGMELLPCPFCGGVPEMMTSSDGFTSIGCMGHSVFGVMIQAGTEAEAVEDWNTRAERTCREVMVDKFFRGCSECGYMWEYMYGIGKRVRPNYCPNCGAWVVG